MDLATLGALIWTGILTLGYVGCCLVPALVLSERAKNQARSKQTIGITEHRLPSPDPSVLFGKLNQHPD